MLLVAAALVVGAVALAGGGETPVGSPPSSPAEVPAIPGDTENTDRPPDGSPPSVVGPGAPSDDGQFSTPLDDTPVAGATPSAPFLASIAIVVIAVCTVVGLVGATRRRRHRRGLARR